MSIAGTSSEDDEPVPGVSLSQCVFIIFLCRLFPSISLMLTGFMPRQRSRAFMPPSEHKEPANGVCEDMNTVMLSDLSVLD